MTSLTIAVDYRHAGYDTAHISDVETLLDNVKKDVRVGKKYKKMTLSDFIKWLELGVTPYQFKKLCALNLGEVYQ